MALAAFVLFRFSIVRAGIRPAAFEATRTNFIRIGIRSSARTVPVHNYFTTPVSFALAGSSCNGGNSIDRIVLTVRGGDGSGGGIVVVGRAVGHRRNC